MTTAPARLSDVERTLRTGETTPDDYVERTRDRFESTEPSIHAFLEDESRWERLERAISDLEARFPDPRSRPPLYGVPVGIKDIFHVTGYETNAGAGLPSGELTGREGTAVSALREAGALILGKTVTAEFAYFDPGPTANPHDTDHTPGGSSSGSAAAVAAGLCPLALGTQTIGSINRPAAFCGVVGVKPSYGRIPIDGVLPVAPSVDHVGYFTQDLEGARLAAGVLYSDWRVGVEPKGRPRIGAVSGPYLEQASSVGQEHVRGQIETLEAAGFDGTDIDPWSDIEGINRRHDRLVAAETALSHDELYPAFGDLYADQTAELIEEGRTVTVEQLGSVRTSRHSLREQIHDVMDAQGIDVLVSPSAPGPAPAGLESTGDPVMNAPWTHAGVPAVTVPAGKTAGGLPMGIQCVGRFGDDEQLLSWCQEIRIALS